MASREKKQGRYSREHEKCAGLKAGGNILGLRYRSGDGRKDWRYPLITFTLVVRSWILDNSVSKVTLAIGPRVGLVLIGFLAVYPGARDEVLSQRSKNWRHLGMLRASVKSQQSY